MEQDDYNKTITISSESEINDEQTALSIFRKATNKYIEAFLEQKNKSSSLTSSSSSQENKLSISIILSSEDSDSVDLDDGTKKVLFNDDDIKKKAIKEWLLQKKRYVPHTNLIKIKYDDIKTAFGTQILREECKHKFHKLLVIDEESLPKGLFISVLLGICEQHILKQQTVIEEQRTVIEQSNILITKLKKPKRKEKKKKKLFTRKISRKLPK